MLNLFSKGPIPDTVPIDCQQVIAELKKCKTKMEALHQAYEYVKAKYTGERIKTYTRFYEIFTMDFYSIWKRRGFVHCHYMNYVLQVLLIKSGHFKDEDIEQKRTLVWYVSLHQYLRINTGEKIVTVDLWGAKNGIEFGDYAHGFH